MAPADGIEVRGDLALWMRLTHLAVGVLGASAILISTALPWMKAALLAALAAVHFATARHARRAAAKIPSLRLLEDGTAALLTPEGWIPAALMEGAWTSRRLSVLRLRPLDGGRPVHCAVARSANTPDDYRRLLVLLRHRGVHERAAHWNWL